jgi:hypothetical protein
MGPILIFDKSTLECLNPDESCWLEAFFLSNITPLFFIETLADLKKEMRAGRTPEEVVGQLAYKTPAASCRPQVHHLTLVQSELMGQEIPMAHQQIPITGGVTTTTADGRGRFFRVSPEEEALQRWQRHEFLDLERQIASRWRLNLSNLNLAGLYELAQTMFKTRWKPTSLQDAKRFADELIDEPGQQEKVLRTALGSLGVLEEAQRAILQRWQKVGRAPFRVFAPYTAHIFSVDMFLLASVGADLISRGRPSNKVDIAYLYYLPFCMVFSSGDKLHARTVPLFLDDTQSFVPAADLKQDLGYLDKHYSELPEEVKAKGIMSFAALPPEDPRFLVTRLWDRHMRADWRKLGTVGKLDPKNEEKLRQYVQGLVDSAEKAIEGRDEDIPDAPTHIIREMRVPARRGKWRLVSAEVEER